MASHSDVCIVGGGAIGLTTAYMLAKQHVQVVLLDKGEFGQESSWAGAGIISPGNPRRARSSIGQLKARSAALFPEFSAELRELTGIDNGYLPCGGLELLQSDEELERRRFAKVIREERDGGASGRVLDAAMLQELEPALAQDLAGAVWFTGIAQVRNPRHVRALVAACRKLGVRMLPRTAVLDFRKQGSRIVSARSVGDEVHADRFLVSAGAWSDGLIGESGWRPGIRPIRGQIALLRSEPSPFRCILQTGSKYLVPRGDGMVLVGSTEEDVGFDKRTTDDAIQQLLATAWRLVPCLRHAAIERSWAGLRPGSPDGKPVLGLVPGFENLYIAAGHFRSGIHLSPITGMLMCELLMNHEPDPLLASFRPGR